MDPLITPLYVKLIIGVLSIEILVITAKTIKHPKFNIPTNNPLKYQINDLLLFVCTELETI